MSPLLLRSPYLLYVDHHPDSVRSVGSRPTRRTSHTTESLPNRERVSDLDLHLHTSVLNTSPTYP